MEHGNEVAEGAPRTGGRNSAGAGRTYLWEAESAACLSYVNVPFRTLVILPPPRTKVCLAHQTPPASVKIPRMFH